MKRLLSGGRVIDPANGIDGMHDVLIDEGRIAADRQGPSRRRRNGRGGAGGDGRLSGLHRHARASARARTGTQRNGGDRDSLGRRGWVHGRGVHAEHDPGQ